MGKIAKVSTSDTTQGSCLELLLQPPWGLPDSDVFSCPGVLFRLIISIKSTRKIVPDNDANTENITENVDESWSATLGFLILSLKQGDLGRLQDWC